MITVLSASDCCSQLRVTIPSSSSLNVTFGKGSSSTGAPLQVGSTDFKYTNNACPQPGQYSVTLADECFNIIQHDAGHIFYNPHPLENDSGYMMIVNYQASTVSKTVFEDTIKNICSNNQYLFWAGIRNLSNSSCFYPNFSFIVETLSGQTIETFQTGDIGGTTDKGAPYFGFLASDPRTSFPAYYGGIFTLPAGINTVILKIITNSTNANSSCTNTFAIDNILLTPVGAEVSIADPASADGWVTGPVLKMVNLLHLTAVSVLVIMILVPMVLSLHHLMRLLINGSKVLMMVTHGLIFPEKQILISRVHFLFLILFI